MNERLPAVSPTVHPYVNKIKAYAEAGASVGPVEQQQILILIGLCCEAISGSSRADTLLASLEKKLGIR